MTKDEIVEAVKTALGSHPCRFDIDPKELDHLIGVVIDLGDGSLREGIETLRHNHLWLRDRREKERDKEYTANHVMMTKIRDGSQSLITTIAKGLAMAIIIGLAVLAGIGLNSKGN